jgi:two-component system sensor histidine kinase BaeS
MRQGVTVRLTIARKIALAIIAIVILSVGTMAWITSQNLKSGFIAYLNQLESEHLQEISRLFAEDYRRHGNLDRFADNRRAMRDMLDVARVGFPDKQANAGPVAEANDDADKRPPRPPHRPNHPDRPDHPDRPPREEFPARRPPPPDPMGFGPRLSLIDQDGRILVGPRDTPPGQRQPIVVDGRTVASLSLMPLRQLSHTSASGFVLSQTRQILWLAGGLILLSVLLSIWLARHLLLPVASLRSVTRRISQGQLEARADIVNQDELGELASHVNAMALTLQQNEAQRSKMLANVSHELRTPLTVMRGEIEALIDGIRPTSPGALKSLHEEVLHLSKLVDDIHQVNLAHAGELAFQLQRIDLCTLLNEVLQRYQPRIQAANLTVSSQIPAEPLYVKADADRLTQVFSNLFENSLRYTDAGGQLQCSLSRNGPLLELSVEDSAPGVPDGTHARLFERLYRADQDRSRQRGGSGLGLSICKALIESNHGKIAALPSRLGGIKIVIRLPAVA